MQFLVLIIDVVDVRIQRNIVIEISDPPRRVKARGLARQIADLQMPAPISPPHPFVYSLHVHILSWYS